MNIVIRIVQPRGFNAPNMIREWKTDAVSLRPYFNRLNHAAAEAHKDEPKLCPGTHCRDCRARYVCPPHQEAALSAIDYVANFATLSMTDKEQGVELKFLRRAKDAITHRLSALETEVIEKMKAGTGFTDWTLERTRSTMKWKKDTKVEDVAALGEMFGVEVCKPVALKTPKQVEKLIDATVISGYSESIPGNLALKRFNPNEVFK